jgi:single-stranded DNA-binding protein
VHVNVCTLVGRVSQAGAKLTYASSGTPICSLVVEVDEMGPGEKIFTTWLPVRITGRYAEQSSIDLEPGDIVQISGKLKYESSMDVKTQQKTSKLVISTWGIQQRQPALSESAQVARTDPDEGRDQGDGSANAPEPKVRRPRTPKMARQPWQPSGLLSEN